MGEQSLGRMIRRRRESLGFSQARLGELVGRSASTIRNWERGKSTPAAPADAVALAAVLGLEEHRVVEAAGFETGDVETHETVEQAYASLSPQRSGKREESGGVGPVSPHRAIEFPEGKERGPSRAAEPDRPAEEAAVSPGPETIDPPVRWESVSPRPEPPRARPVRAIEQALQPAADEEREVARAAPPTVLEAAGPEEPSYLEDPEERQRYRTRAIATAAVVLFLVIVFLWSFDRAVDALGTMWNDFMGMLEL